MFHGVIQKITLTQFFLRHGVYEIDRVTEAIAEATKYLNALKNQTRKFLYKVA